MRCCGQGEMRWQGAKYYYCMQLDVFRSPHPGRFLNMGMLMIGAVIFRERRGGRFRFADLFLRTEPERVGGRYLSS